MFDRGLDLVSMLTIDCALDGLSGDVRLDYINWLKNDEPGTWADYVDQKKMMGVIVKE